jgi:hypothetical protein
MSSEKDVSALLARVECYDTCIEQLKKELPKYFLKHSQVSKESYSSFAKILRNVASLEPNEQVQTAIFLYAQKSENLENERKLYEKCHSSSMSLLEVAKTKMVAPAKVRMNSLA